MNKKILKEIKLIKKFLLQESWLDLFKDLGIAGKSEAKATFSELKGLFASTGADAKALSNFEQLVGVAKKLTPAEKDVIKVNGKNVRELVKDFHDAVKAGDKAKINSLTKDLESAAAEAKEIKAGRKVPGPTPGPTPGPSPVPTVTGDSVLKGLSKEQQHLLIRYEKDMQSADSSIAETAKQKYKEIMYPELAREVGTTPKGAKELTKDIAEIDEYLNKVKGTPAEFGEEAAALRKRRDQLTGTGVWAKVKNFCVNNKKTCMVLGIAGAYGLYKGGKAIGQSIGIVDPDKPGPTPGPGGGGRKYIACPDTKLKKLCAGENVKKLQDDLIKLGYKLEKYGEDGKFWRETEAAVKALQKDTGLKVDGIAGQETLAKIEELLSGKKEVINPPATTSLSPTAGPSSESKPQMQEYFQESYYIKPIKNRHEMLEQLVFKRMVNGCK